MAEMRPVHAFIANLRTAARAPYDGVADVLWARGFLVERNDGVLIMSDNAHPDDQRLLHDQLAGANLGIVQGGHVMLRDGVEPEDLTHLFRCFDGCEAFECPSWSRWRNFRNRVHGPKVPVALLEPFVAALVKATNAIGVGTCSAGDGQGRQGLNVLFTGVYHGAWFEVVLNAFLRNRLPLACEWQMNGSRLSINAGGRSLPHLYIEALSAAKALYDHRAILRGLKQTVARALDRRCRKTRTYEDVYQLMRDELRRYDMPHLAKST